MIPNALVVTLIGATIMSMAVMARDFKEASEYGLGHKKIHDLAIPFGEVGYETAIAARVCWLLFFILILVAFFLPVVWLDTLFLAAGAFINRLVEI